MSDPDDLDYFGDLGVAYRAFCAYTAAKRKADRTLTFFDAHDAAQAWVRFLNCYLPPEDQSPLSNIVRVDFSKGQRL